MKSKLDELAAKEAELRRINDALDIKKNNLLSGGNLDADEENKSSDNSFDGQFKGQNLGKFAAAAAKIDAEDDDEDYGDGNFENDPAQAKKQADDSFKNKFQFKMADDEDDDMAAATLLARNRAAAAQLAASAESNQSEDGDDDGLQTEMYAQLKIRYDVLMAKHSEQDKTINFQKAKIAALQTELEESLQTQAEQKTKLDLTDKETGKAAEVDKKTTEKINQLNLQVSKLKNQISSQNDKIKDYEQTLSESKKEIDATERDKRRQQQDVGNKDAKLNRALEEIEKYKLALRESKINETGKNDTVRRDLDRLTEENRKMERQRNELLQAFKKQMKLIDVLKRQKMHIESAKLLAFTEDEFVRTLELGDKL